MQSLRFKNAPYGIPFILVAKGDERQRPLYLSQTNTYHIWHEVSGGWLKYLPIPSTIIVQLEVLNPFIIPLHLEIDRSLELRFYRGSSADVHGQVKEWFAPLLRSLYGEEA